MFSDPKDTIGKTAFRFRHVNTGRLMKIQEVTLFNKKLTTLGLGDHIDQNGKEGK